MSDKSHEREDKEAQASEDDVMSKVHEHIEQHSSRLETLEKLLGIHHKADGMESEESEPARRHKARSTRDENLAKRKRK